MLYDVRLKLDYDYDSPVAGGRHLLRVMPRTLSGVQRVVAASLSVEPAPVERGDRRDFFGNAVSTIAYRAPHEALEIAMTARVEVSRTGGGPAAAVPLSALPAEIGAVWSVAPDSPHHFTGPSDRVGREPAIAAYARERAGGAADVAAAVAALCLAVHRDFDYDAEATEVSTTPAEAFALRAGVCQDFAHVAIAGLRGLGIPAGYVSGFLRTKPPPGGPRLEGADAMHAWVRAWCGREAGWLEFDPTNAMAAGEDHIVIGYGRDYADVTPILGVFKTTGGQTATQSVDVAAVG